VVSIFLDYDPLPALQKIKCPVLALNGEKDLQVSAADNLPLIQKTLEDAGTRNVTTKSLPELNHLFQHAESGSPVEYGAIEETNVTGSVADDRGLGRQA